MRVQFIDLAHAKKVSKALKKSSPLSLSSLRSNFAKSCGYSDWHELENTRFKDVSKNGQYPYDTGIVAALSKTSLSCKVSSSEVADTFHRLGVLSAWPTQSEIIELQGKLLRLCELQLSEGNSYSRQFHQKGSSDYFTSKSASLAGGITGWTTGSFSSLRASSDLIEEVIETRLCFDIPTRFYLPYGYIEDDGVRTIFDRDYLPIYKIFSDGSVSRLSPTGTIGVRDFKFFWDGTIDWGDPSLNRSVEQIYLDNGIAGLPSTLRLLPRLLRNEGARMLRDII